MRSLMQLECAVTLRNLIKSAKNAGIKIWTDKKSAI